ncbi:MAG: hypothetical protein IJS38_00780 [Erysipelotrichaceae bacterium]|nr:hypothetical protein [Erysipelotrichaceae bacterium]
MKKNNLTIIIVSTVIVILATMLYLRDHNYEISSEEFSGADKPAGWLAMEGVLIEASGDSRQLNIKIRNQSETDIDMYSEFPVSGLYILRNGGWHFVANRGDTEGGKGPNTVIQGKTEHEITINCRRKFGGYLPAGEYLIRVIYQSTEGQWGEQIVRFRIG